MTLLNHIKLTKISYEIGNKLNFSTLNNIFATIKTPNRCVDLKKVLTKYKLFCIK